MALSMIDIVARRSQPTRLSNLVLDGTMETNHSYKNRKTSYPVEEGADISDHVRAMPDIVTISGKFSSHPIRILEGQIPDEGDRIDLAHTELLKLAGRSVPQQPGDTVQATSRTPEVIDIICFHRIYTDMIITSLEIPDNPRNKHDLEFTVICEEYNTATTELSVVNNASDLDGKAQFSPDQAQKKVNAGVTRPQDVPSGSALNDIVNGIFGRTQGTQEIQRGQVE